MAKEIDIRICNLAQRTIAKMKSSTDEVWLVRIKNKMICMGVNTDKFDKIYIDYLKALPYPEYLKTKHWTDLKRKKIIHTNRRCEGCGTTREKLYVHHVTYKNRGKEELEDLRVLCKDCHGYIHRKIKHSVKQIVNSFLTS